YGELGATVVPDINGDDLRPTPLAAPVTGVKTISPGGEGDPAGFATDRDFTCAGLTNGTMECSGNNFYGQLGRGPDAGEGLDDPHPGAGPVVGLSGVAQASAGYWHACARNEEGGIWCWGNNESGPVGTSDLSPGVRILDPTAANRDGGVSTDLHAN